MQSNTARGIAVALLVGVVAVFIVIGGGDDDNGSGDKAAPAAVGKTEEPTETGKAEKKQAKPDKPKVPTIVFRNGSVVGGIEKLTFASGGQIVFKVKSDTADHVHLHGYDVMKDVAPGSPVAFKIKADIEGIFELELESSATELASIRVEP